MYVLRPVATDVAGFTPPGLFYARFSVRVGLLNNPFSSPLFVKQAVFRVRCCLSQPLPALSIVCELKAVVGGS